MKHRGYGPSEVKAIADVRKKLPTESDFKGKKGYRRFHVDATGEERPGPAKDGTYEWAYSFKPNTNGKPTRQAAMVSEMLRPFQQAEMERYQKNRGTLGHESQVARRARVRGHVISRINAAGRYQVWTDRGWKER